MCAAGKAARDMPRIWDHERCGGWRIAAAMVCASLLTVGIAVATSAPAPAARAQARAFTIHTSDGAVTRIGALRTFGRDGGSLARATAVFGRPSSIDPIGNGSDACRIEWRDLRLNATFANFGLESACSPGGGRLQAATIRSSRFRTTRGVRVGSRSSTIPLKHRAARFIDGAWWIASLTPPFGDEQEIATVSAIVRDGRVRALRLWVGAAGD
jgi:hypothetical protein